jgi:hypothetical protein
MPDETIAVRPLNVTLRSRSKAEEGFFARATMPTVLAPGIPPTPNHDLKYHGGRIIAKLEFFNFYVGGSQSWNTNDIQSINQALEAAMSDPHLNNVMVQYFLGEPITTTFQGFKILSGSKPALVSQGDVEGLLRRLYRAGKLRGFNLDSTVIDFLLPSGTVLNTDETPTAGALSAQAEQENGGTSFAIPHEEEDSTHGLGGYHGSIHVGHAGHKRTLYYAVGVFSEILADGTENGIAVFDKPWKNVVATFYHELNEARTDPDVQDAIDAGDSPEAVKFLGWTSNQGEECGDFPVFEANPLTKVFKEVPLTAGPGTAPVQFQYSNAVHGPEGPIAHPHPAAAAIA